MFTPDEDWNEATPQDIPSPTYWPVVVAMGVTFILWGFLTHKVIIYVGGGIFAIGLAGWIADLRDAMTSNDNDQNKTENGS